MTSASFDFAPVLAAGLPAPAARWTGLAKYSFVGGNNDPDQVPVDGLIDAINAVLRREGKTLATKSLAMVAMMAGAGRSNELRVHVKGALTNGCSAEQIQDILLLVAMYCGIPAANEAHRIAVDVLRETEAK